MSELDLNQVVATGIRRELEPDKKDYQLKYGDDTWMAIRGSGKKFDCCGFHGTIKEIKEMILVGKIKPESDVPGKQAKTDPVTGKRSTWECVHPCAWMVTLPFALPQAALETLDAYGWLDEEGKPDWKRANREMKRFEVLKERDEEDEEDEEA